MEHPQWASSHCFGHPVRRSPPVELADGSSIGLPAGKSRPTLSATRRQWPTGQIRRSQHNLAAGQIITQLGAALQPPRQLGRRRPAVSTGSAPLSAGRGRGEPHLHRPRPALPRCCGSRRPHIEPQRIEKARFSTLGGRAGHSLLSPAMYLLSSAQQLPLGALVSRSQQSRNEDCQWRNAHGRPRPDPEASGGRDLGRPTALAAACAPISRRPPRRRSLSAHNHAFFCP